jgi:SAM-dependent methyltransferase
MKQLGAASVTGVDISDEAIDFARKLSADSGLAAMFHRADVYEWLAKAGQRDERWDVVFCSYGAIIWLSDLETWACGIASVLRPGGHFVTVEFHPFAWAFDENLVHKFPYSTHGTAMTWSDGIGDYVGEAGAVLAPSGWEDGVQNFRNPSGARVRVESVGGDGGAAGRGTRAGAFPGVRASGGHPPVQGDGAGGRPPLGAAAGGARSAANVLNRGEEGGVDGIGESSRRGW